MDQHWLNDKLVDDCEGCRKKFNLTRRKHHCRYCGHIFCANCSGKTSQLPPEYGYEEPQRVCDTCYTKLSSQSSYAEVEIVNAGNFLRQTQFQVSNPLLLIGSRNPPRKSFFQVRESQGPSQLMTMATMYVQEDIGFGSKEGRKMLRNLLCSIRHPFVYSTNDVGYLPNKDKIAVFRDFVPAGSLKDLTYRKKKLEPVCPYAKKYQGPGTPLQESQIALFGRQVLEGLKYLRSQKILFDHLHSGNVLLVEDNRCCITDYENSLLRLSSRYEKYFSEKPSLDRDILCFGVLIYELATGVEPTSMDLSLNSMPPCPRSIQDLIEEIFNHPDDQESPSVKELLQRPIFQGVSVRVDTKDVGQLESESRKLCRKISKMKLESGSVEASTTSQADRKATLKQRRKSRRTIAVPEESLVDTSGTEAIAAVSQPSSTAAPPSSSSTPAASSAPPPAPPPPTGASAPPPPPPPPPSGGGAPAPPPPPPPAAAPAPPPPAAPPAAEAAASQPPIKASGDRGDLLAAIRRGSTLKKVAPPTEKNPSIPASGGDSSGGGGAAPAAPAAAGGPMSLMEQLKMRQMSKAQVQKPPSSDEEEGDDDEWKD